MTRLRRVGFYRELAYGDARDPSLRAALSTAPVPRAQEIARYLTSAPSIAVAPMVSYDVLDPQRPLGTPSLHTDGVWVWPSDVAHYVTTHHLQLPVEFVDHMRECNWQPPADEPAGDIVAEGFVEMSDSASEGGDDA